MASVAAEKGSISVLDVGGTPRYWERVGLAFLGSINARVVVLNRHERELGDASPSELITLETGDGCRLAYEDQTFDLCHSNSVIEHVETWANMKAFAAETRRVARGYYVQTPYFWFPIDPHYYRMPMFHWFPRPLRARFVNQFPLAYSGRAVGVDAAFKFVDNAQLLDARQFRFLFPDSELRFERFAGLAKSMIAIRRQPDSPARCVASEPDGKPPTVENNLQMSRSPESRTKRRPA
jgi:hypothetical protein